MTKFSNQKDKDLNRPNIDQDKKMPNRNQKQSQRVWSQLKLTEFQFQVDICFIFHRNSPKGRFQKKKKS